MIVGELDLHSANFGFLAVTGERGKQDTIRGVQIRAGTVYVVEYIFIPNYVTFRVRDWSKCELRVAMSLQPGTPELYKLNRL